MTVAFVERPSETIAVVRRVRGTCLAEAWDRPDARRAAVADALEAAVRQIGASGPYTFVAPAPVSLYCHPITGEPLVAFINVGPPEGRWITPQGKPFDEAPYAETLAKLVRLNTSYASWAEGPLFHVDLASAFVSEQVALPLEMQQLRAQNGALRDVIDAHMGPSDRVSPAQDATADHGLVDFRLRLIFTTPSLRILDSLQTGEASKVIAGDGSVLDHFDEVEQEERRDARNR